MAILKKVGVLSFAKIEAVLMAIAGFFEGAVFAVSGTLAGGSALTGGLLGLIYGPIAIVLFPILFAILGFVLGAVMSFLYNILAKWIGGVEIELE